MSAKAALLRKRVEHALPTDGSFFPAKQFVDGFVFATEVEDGPTVSGKFGEQDTAKVGRLLAWKDLKNVDEPEVFENVLVAGAGLRPKFDKPVVLGKIVSKVGRAGGNPYNTLAAPNDADLETLANYLDKEGLL